MLVVQPGFNLSGLTPQAQLREISAHVSEQLYPYQHSGQLWNRLKHRKHRDSVISLLCTSPTPYLWPFNSPKQHKRDGVDRPQASPMAAADQWGRGCRTQHSLAPQGHPPPMGLPALPRDLHPLHHHTIARLSSAGRGADLRREEIPWGVFFLQSTRGPTSIVCAWRPRRFLLGRLFLPSLGPAVPAALLDAAGLLGEARNREGSGAAPDLDWVGWDVFLPAAAPRVRLLQGWNTTRPLAWRGGWQHHCVHWSQAGHAEPHMARKEPQNSPIPVGPTGWASP